MVHEGEQGAPSTRIPVGIAQVRVRRARDNRLDETDDALAVEEPLEIRVGRADDRGSPPRSLSVTMRTPGQDVELAVGFLFSEGILRSREDIASVGYTRSHVQGPSENVIDVVLERGVSFDPVKFERHFYTTSSCGVCGRASLDAVRVLGVRRMAEDRPRVSAETIPRIPDRLRQGQTLFAATGGLHAAGRFSREGDLLSLREDVGRHNAVDKLIGERVLAGGIPFRDDVLAVSGRASFEILQKAAVAGVAFVVAVGAPSSLAVDFAREYGMTLVGFARDQGFNVYAGAERLVRPAVARSRP